MVRQLIAGMVALLVFLSALPVVAAEAPPPVEAVEPESEPLEEITPLIFNGDPAANPGWVVSILQGDSYICSGTLIHPQFVLTAAHCVTNQDGAITLGLGVRVGSNIWSEGTGRSLAQVYVHPAYDPNQVASVDLAVVRLNAAIPAAKTARLVGSPSWPLLSQTLRVYGWGETSTGSQTPSQLQTATVAVGSDPAGKIDSNDCLPAWVAAADGDDFCFGGASWACSGDSGGPLVGRATPTTTTGAIDVLYGVTSYGQVVGCSDEVRLDTMAQGVGRHVNWIRSFLPTTAAGGPGDEMFFYRTDGLFRFYDVANNGGLSKPILAGDGYTTGWSTITGIDLDGDSQDEMFFYRKDGLFRFYNVQPNGSLPSPMLAGQGYTTGWDSITAVDLEGDGQDEMFFYRGKDGLFRFYNIHPNGHLGTPILQGSGYTRGWDSISAVDLNGDGQDEMFFYRDDGLFRYYNVNPNGSLSPILQGSGYTTGWDSITSIDLDGDGQDEMFFYRDDGLFRYYNVNSGGHLGSPILQGSGYTTGWDSITAVELSG